MKTGTILDLALCVLFLLNGILTIRRSRRGTWREREILTLGNNPGGPDSMAPGMQSYMWYLGLSLIALGLFGLLLNLLELFHA